MPPMFGLIRGVTVGVIVGVTVGVMVGMRDPMLMLGERMKACARTDGLSRYTNGKAARVNASAARRIFISQLARSWTMGPRVHAGSEEAFAGYGVVTARLTIFSPCSLFIR